MHDRLLRDQRTHSLQRCDASAAVILMITGGMRYHTALFVRNCNVGIGHSRAFFKRAGTFTHRSNL